MWLGLLGGASLFGLFAGALLTGPAADRFGRRHIFAYNMALLAALSLLQGLAATAPQLLLLRLAIGFLLGTDYVVSKAAPDRIHAAARARANSRGCCPSPGLVVMPALTLSAWRSAATVPRPGCGCCSPVRCPACWCCRCA